MDYTLSDYYSLKPEGTNKWELIKGVFKMSPAPLDKHQRISVDMVTMINMHFKRKKCEVREAPYDVVLGNNVVQPDICVICDTSKITRRGCNGIPDLIVEILSETNEKLDRLEKFNLYEEYGLKEYWIVHPDDEWIEKWILDGNKFKLLETITAAGNTEIKSENFPDLVIKLNEIF